MTTTATAVSTQDVRCSFCGKHHEEVAKVIAGPGVYICNECVDLSTEILRLEAASPSPRRLPEWESMTDEQMLEGLPRIAAVSSQVETSLRSWVEALRSRGVTWTRIGAALGMTRQSAWGRFSGEE